MRAETELSPRTDSTTLKKVHKRSSVCLKWQICLKSEIPNIDIGVARLASDRSLHPQLRLSSRHQRKGRAAAWLFMCVYRVARNKIPHQTICNISATSGQDFKNSWSCLILTLLWIQRYTMYSLHLNYTTTLPRKTITIKITIFTRDFLVTP